jgi:hypothetical protein
MMACSKDLEKLSKLELIDLIDTIMPTNQISISGIMISSQNSSLKEIEEVANRLLEKHKDFLLLRKQNKILGCGD